MGTNLMGELVADQGTYIANNTTEVTKTIEAIVCLEDTIFTSIKVAGTDVKATYIAATGTAVKAGAIITPINNLQFSGVKLTSGSVALILG
jgi:hypothetical protein